MTMKEQASFSERRRAKRVPAPTGTRILLRDRGFMDSINIRDISSVGMLISNSLRKSYDLNSTVVDILIDIPMDEFNTNSNVFLFINKGKIVRSFFDESSQTYCYGVEFIYDSIYIKEKIESLVNKIALYH